LTAHERPKKTISLSHYSLIIPNVFRDNKQVVVRYPETRSG